MDGVQILLVEDEEADIMLIERFFKKSKIANTITSVKTGQDALTLLRDGMNFDLILLDLNLPGLNGKEVLAEIKGDEDLKHMPVAVMTSSKAEADIVKSYKLGANCYIQKPVNLNEIEKIIHSIENFWFSIVTRPPSGK